MDDYIRRKMKENGDIFRNALERIVQKYSNLDGSGMEVCLQSMTCQTKEGIRAWDGNEAERQMKSLQRMADLGDKSDTGPENGGYVQLDASHCDDSSSIPNESQMERSTDDLFWESGADGSALLSSTVSDAHSDVQPEEQDDELERTLSSQGSTLLDLYPSMLSQVGEACRRQQVTEAASAVLRRYRRRGWHSSTQRRNRLGNRPASNGSMMRRAPLGRQRGNREGSRQTLVMDITTPTSSAPSSPEEHPDMGESLLSRTYMVSSSQRPSKPEGGTPAQLLSSREGWGGCSPPVQQGAYLSWNQMTKPERLVHPVPSDAFRALVPDRKNSFPSLAASPGPARPSSTTLQTGPVENRGEPYFDLLTSGHQSSQPSPLKWEPQYPMLSPQKLPLPGSNSSQKDKCPRHSPSASCPPSPCPAIRSWGGRSSRLQQRRRSFSGFQDSVRATRSLIDLEFEKVYQRLVSQCKASLPPCSQRPVPFLSPAAEGSQRGTEASSSSSLAALALSPLWTRVRKRYRDLDQEVSPRSKRFREKHNLSPGSARQADSGSVHCRRSDSCLTSMLSDSPRQMHCWSACRPPPRPLLLQGSSPGPTRTLGNLFRKASGSADSLQESHFYHASRCEGDALPAAYEGRSPVRARTSLPEWQSGLSRLFRRRLLYGLPQ